MKASLTTIEKALFLKELEVFASVSVENLADLAAVAEETHYEPGTEITQAGQPAIYGYIIVEGNVVAERDGVIVSTLNPRQGFGDLSLVADSTYLTTTRTVDHAHLLRIRSEDVVDVMLDHPEIAVAMVRALALRNRDLVERLADLSRRFQDAPETPRP